MFGKKCTIVYEQHEARGGAVAEAPAKGSLSIPQLRAGFKGKVIAPGDADYDRARTIFYGGMESLPAVIIRPVNDDEVAQVIALARKTGLELAVRSGGHSNAGHSATLGGILLDLGDMRALDIDAKAQTAWAEAGLTAEEYTKEAAKY